MLPGVKTRELGRGVDLVDNNQGVLAFPPTKFPPGFDPKAHGMIDLSEYIYK